MYMVFIVVLYALVNVLLLKGVSGLLRISLNYIDIFAGAAVSGIYVLLCMITENLYFSSVPMYILSVLLTSFLSFGLRKRYWTGMFCFMLLYLALGGVCVEKKELLSLTIGTVGILLVVYLMPSGRNREYLPVRLRYNSRDYRFLALLDTGNFLKDPITGGPVLIVGADIAQEMTGLTAKQLRAPVESLSLLPGSRLIPYKTAGISGLFFLGLYVQNLKVGPWKGSGVIALSPELFGSKETYQALTGGYV